MSIYTLIDGTSPLVSEQLNESCRKVQVLRSQLHSSELSSLLRNYNLGYDLRQEIGTATCNS